jgi:hypothetical protein
MSISLLRSLYLASAHSLHFYSVTSLLGRGSEAKGNGCNGCSGTYCNDCNDSCYLLLSILEKDYETQENVVSKILLC